MAAPKTINYSALAPFGRIGYLLGWRWVFYFTFPIPFHPWLFRALPIGVGLWIAALAIGPGPVHWTRPLVAALILAVPLSVPFLQWILFTFRIHLIQAAMLPAALLLLGVAAVAGEEPLWALALPVLYFLGHAAAVAIGHSRLAAWEADNAAVEALATGTGPLPPLVVRGRPGMIHRLPDLLRKLDLPAIHIEEDGFDKLLVRIDDPDLIAWLQPLRKARLDLFEIPKGQGPRVVSLRADPPSDPWILEPAPPPARRFLKGEVAAVQATRAGQSSLTYHYGRPAPLSWFPGFWFFMRLQLGSNAAFVPEVGLVPVKPRPLGKGSEETEAYAALAGALRTEGAPPPPFADPVEVRRRVQALLDTVVGPELDALERLIASPATWMDRKLDQLLKLPDLYAHRAPELVEALRTARDAQHKPAASLLARLIAALPGAAYQQAGDALMTVLNSKALAGRLRYDEATEAQQPPPFAGFSLLIHVPLLYVRLGELGERARPLIAALRETFPSVTALQDAEATLDNARPHPRYG